LLAKAKSSGVELIIIDLGANVMLRSAMSQMVRGLLEYAGSIGWRTYVILSLISFKSGLDDDADNFGTRFRKYAKIATFFHGREKGGDYRSIDPLNDAFDLSAEVPADQAAIVGLMADDQVLPIDFARNQPPGYIQAAAWVAKHLLCLAKQDAVQQMLGSAAAIPELERLAAAAPKLSYNTLTNKFEVHDAALAADEAMITAQRALYRAGSADDVTLVHAARIFIKAAVARQAGHDAAQKAISTDRHRSQ